MATVYITNPNQLQSAILPSIEKAMKQTQKTINDTIQQTINEYYAEYPKPPRIYNRTNRFLRSLFVSNISVVGNRVTANVELDELFLGTVYNPRTGFTGQDVAEWADLGLHGKGKTDGTKFWQKAYAQLGDDLGIVNLLIDNLEKNGITFS